MKRALERALDQDVGGEGTEEFVKEATQSKKAAVAMVLCSVVSERLGLVEGASSNDVADDRWVRDMFRKAYAAIRADPEPSDGESILDDNEDQEEDGDDDDDMGDFIVSDE